MPTTIYIPKEAKHAGIDITWTPSAQRLDISGWYNSYVGIPSESMTLRQFFDGLGITQAECIRAFKR